MPRPLPVVAATFLVTQFYSAPDARHAFVNRMCIFDPTASQTQANIARDVANAHDATLGTVMSNDITYGQTSVLALDGISSTQTFTTATTGQTGSHAGGNQLPYAVCQVVSWQTGLRGRSKRGRSYIPGVASNQVLDARANLLNPADQATLTTEGNAFLTALAGLPHPLELHVLSLKLGTATKVINARGDVALGIQRRRYEKVARH